LEFSDGIAEPQMSLLPYVGFCTMMLGVMSLTFQMPLLAFLLGRLNLLKRSFLKKYWRESFIAMLILAAILTPSQDPFTLILVAFALFILYGICLLVTP
jgi:sec-independent protein translocase protein TatC